MFFLLQPVVCLSRIVFFSFEYRSIVRRGVEFSKRMCLLVHGSGLSRT